MLKIDKEKQYIYNSEMYRMPTPDGLMYVNLMENKDKKLCGIQLEIGKAGSSLRAWCQVTGRLLTMLLDKGATIYELLEELSNQSSDRIAYIGNGRKVRSAIEGLYVVLTRYHAEKVSAELNGDRRPVGFFRNRRKA